MVEHRNLRRSIANVNLHKRYRRHFLRLLSPFTKYSHFKIRDPENVGQGHDVVAPFAGKYMTSYLIAIAMYALPPTVWAIFAKTRKRSKTFQGQKL